MSDFLGRLAQRVVAPQTLLQPRAPSLFETAPAETMPAETMIDTAVPPREIVTAAVSPRPAERAPEAVDAEASEEIAPAERVAAKTRHENAPPPAPPLPRTPAVIAREVIERIRIEADDDAALAPPARDTAPPSDRPSELPATPSTITRVITRRAAERRPLHRATPLEAKENESSPAAERDVHITIGRIDVRAVTPPSRERPAAKPPRTLTLDEYLSQRGRR